METKKKFKFKVFLYYLLIEPWTERFSIPNLRTLAWAFIILSVFLKSIFLLIISVAVGIISHLVYEFKSGKFIYWYRNRKFKEQRDSLRKKKEEGRNGI